MPLKNTLEDKLIFKRPYISGCCLKLCISEVLLVIPMHSPLYRLSFVYAASFTKSLIVSYVHMEGSTFGSQIAVEVDAQVVGHVLDQA